MDLCRSTRVSVSFFMGYVELAQTAFGDPVMALTYLGMIQGNVGHLDRDLTSEEAQRWSDLDAPPPDELRRPISILALSGSLGLPRESVRRKVQVLTNLGLAVPKGRGYIVPAAVVQATASVEALRKHVVSLNKLLAALAADGAAGLDPQAPVHVGDTKHRLLARLVGDYVLRLVFDLRETFGEQVLAGIIFLALVEAALPLDEDTAPQPLSAHMLAARIWLPRETTRRHVNKLLADGLIAAGPDGLTPLPDPLSHPGLKAAAMANEVHLRWLLGQLRRSGILQPGPAPEAAR